MLSQIPGPYLKDGDGFVPPELGGTVGEKYFPFTFSTASGATAFILPAGATITSMSVIINDVFSGGTTTLSIGHTGSATYYMNAASVLGTAGPVFSTAWSTKAKWFTKLSSPETITISVGAGNSAGTAVLIVRYIMQ